MAILDGQTVMVKWNGNNRNLYESKGYVFTRFNEEFEVDVKDVSTSSRYEVKYKCDYCDEIFMRSIISSHNRNKHYCSDECRERGLNPNGMTNKERLDYSIDCLKVLKEKLNKIPTVTEYDKYAKEKCAFSRRVIQVKLNENWNDLCNQLFEEVNVVKKSKEEMIDDLIVFKNKLGRTPLTEELIPNGLPNVKTYMRKFNMTFNELIVSLGWETNGNFTAEIPKEELLDKYMKLYKKLGRIPLRHDIDNEKDFPSILTYNNKFGSIKNICDILDITISADNLELNSVGYGISLIDKHNDFCRSVPEMIITNILIDSEIKYIKEYDYNKIINTDETKRRFDWFIPECNVCVEYFGMYDKKSKNEIFIKYRKSVHKKIVDCANNNVNLISLYPNDLENDYEGLINKFKEFGLCLYINDFNDSEVV